jgi:prefoldin subunit 5
MSSETDNLVLEHLRHIRSAVDLTNQKVTELTFRVGMLENNVASLQGQYAHISNRIDRVDERLTLIEQRLGLVEV